MGRRLNEVQAEKWTLPFDHAAIAANGTVKLYKVPAGRTLRLDRASYNNPTGLVADATNAIGLTIKNGATVVNTVFNTLTGTGGATLAVDTFVEGTAAATDSARVFQAGDVLSAVFLKSGTGALALGHLVLEGRLF